MTDWANWQRRWGQSHELALPTGGAGRLEQWLDLGEQSWALGWRRCYRQEDVPVAEAEAQLALWRAKGVHAALRESTYARVGASANRQQGATWTALWLTHTAEDLATALALDRCERSDAPRSERDAATRAIGLLLGYPACCTEAFLQLPNRGDNDGWWRHLATHSAVGAASCVLNPIDVVDRLYLWFPCSFQCAATRAFGARWLAHLQAVLPLAAALVEASLRVRVLITDSGHRLWHGCEDGQWWTASAFVGNDDVQRWAKALLAEELAPVADARRRVVRADGNKAWLLDFRGPAGGPEP